MNLPQNASWAVVKLLRAVQQMDAKNSVMALARKGVVFMHEA